MATPVYLAPAITAGATLVAATIGFGAAALKHRWDVADNKRTWERERTERRRDELKTGAIEYLAARANVVESFLVRRDDRAVIVTRATDAFENFCILLVNLPLASRVVTDDYESLGLWMRMADDYWKEVSKQISRLVPLDAPPSAREVREMVNNLLSV